MWPVLNQTERALMLSQSGPMCGEPFICFPSTKETRFDPQSFRLLLLRRLRLPFRSPRVVADVAVFTTLVAIIAQRAHERVFRAGGASLWRQPRHGYVGKQVTNMLVRDLDLAPGANTTDGRRLEVVVDGLSIFQGAADGTPPSRAATIPGAALDDALTRKESTNPELVGEGSRAKLVVLAAEVGGRWPAEAALFVVRWRRPKHGQRQRSCKRRWLGGTVGEGCWLAPRQKLSQVGDIPSVHNVVRQDLHVR